MTGSGLDLAGARVAVTGATGFIGRHLVRALRARGARVVGVVRSPERGADLAAAGVELRRADLADRAALAAAFTGCDAVLANAGLISVGGRSRAQLVATNVGGTRNVFEAMAAAGVGRAVMTSSAVVYRPRPDHHYTEGDPLRDEGDPSGPFTHYAVSKACAEREAWRLAERFGLALSTARPQTVFGAHDRSTFTRWFRRLMAPPVSVFPAGVSLPSVHAGDLADAICRMLERPAAAGRAYNVAGEPGAHTYWDLLRAYREAGGRTPRLVIPLPVPVRRSYDISRARRDLGWRPRPLVEGFRELLAVEP